MRGFKSNGRVSVRDIAAKVGCSHSTVSRAIAGNRRVGDSLKEEILMVAEKMGYKRNPMIASLMTAKRQRENINKLSANIGWIHYSRRLGTLGSPSHEDILKNVAEKRARELGYGFEEIRIDEEDITGRRITQIAESRCVLGLICNGPIGSLIESGFDIQKFSVVGLNDYWNEPFDYSKVCSSCRKNAILTVEKLIQYGYNRIGFALSVRDEEVCFEGGLDLFNAGLSKDFSFSSSEALRSALSGFLYMQFFRSNGDRIPPFIYKQCEADSYHQVAQYIKTYNIDALICWDSEIVHAAEIAQVRIPEELAIAHISVNEKSEGWAGINQHSQIQARTAIELLVHQIETNGSSSILKNNYIGGSWVDGWTAPDRL